MRRALALTSTMLVALAAAGVAQAVQPGSSPPSATGSIPAATSWADPQIRGVTAAGILGDGVAGFRPSDPLTRGELSDALVAWRVRAGSGRSFEARHDERARRPARGGARASPGRATNPGCRPRCRAGAAILGTETVARLLGLRLDHPVGSDDLELGPTQPATRAEAAFSLARAMALTPGQIGWLDQLSTTFSPPELDDWQRAVLGRALKFVGYPYVWAGTSEVTQKVWSTTAADGAAIVPGGFDCSGFVWRVYKTKPFNGCSDARRRPQGADNARDERRGEEPARIALADLEPGDVIFFGSRGDCRRRRGGPHRHLRR